MAATLSATAYNGRMIVIVQSRIALAYNAKTGRKLFTLEGHSDGVFCLGISEKESAIFTGSVDTTIKKWDLKSGALLATLEGHSDEVFCLGISEKKGAIFTGSGDKTIKKWDLKSGALLATLEGHSDWVRCLGISEKEGAIFTGSDDKTIKKWDLKSGALLATLEGHSSLVICLGISEKEGAIFTGSVDNTIKKWDLKSGTLLATLEGHSETVWCLGISEEESAIFTGSDDKTIKKWDLKSGALLATLEGHSDWVRRLGISEKESAIFTGSDDKTIKKWDLKSGALLATLEGHSGEVTCLGISEKEIAIFTGSVDNTIKKWDLKSLKSGALLATLKGHSRTVWCLGISEKESAIFTGSGDKTIKKWDLKSGALLATLEGHSGEVTCLGISEKEIAIFTGSLDKTIKKWDLKSGALLATLEGHSDEVWCLGISEKESAIFTGSMDKTIKKWDLKSGTLLATLEGHSKTVRCLGISEEEGAICTGSDDMLVRIWDCSSGELIHESKIHSSRVLDIAISASGMMVSASTKLVAVDVKTLVKKGIVVSTTFPEPGLSLEKRFLPHALFMQAVVTKLATIGQLASFAVLKKAMPTHWVPPAHAFDRLACLGFNFATIIEFSNIFTAVCVTVWMSCLVFCMTGFLRDYVTLFPESKVAKYSFLAFGFFFRLIAGAAFVPFIKVCLWPLADADGFQGACGSASACMLSIIAFRLAAIDSKLDWVGSFENPCAFQSDRRFQSDDAGRNYVHPLSSKSNGYDMIGLVIRLLFMLNSLFLSGTPLLGVIQAAFRILLGIANLILGCLHAPYFEPFLGGMDQNALQTAIDSSLLVVYIASFIAVLAANDVILSQDQLEAVWLAVTPLLAIPTAWISYNMRTKSQRCEALWCKWQAWLHEKILSLAESCQLLAQKCCRKITEMWRGSPQVPEWSDISTALLAVDARFERIVLRVEELESRMPEAVFKDAKAKVLDIYRNRATGDYLKDCIQEMEDVLQKFPKSQCSARALAARSEVEHMRNAAFLMLQPKRMKQVLFYLASKTLTSLKEKLEQNTEVMKADFEKVLNPDLLDDEEEMLPVDIQGLAKEFHGLEIGSKEKMIEKLAPKGAAEAFVKAEELFEANKYVWPEEDRPKPMTGKDWKDPFKDRPRVGDRVRLSKIYRCIRGAAEGPLKPGDIGTLLFYDKASEPFLVDTNGNRKWYRLGAIEVVKDHNQTTS